MSGLVTLDVAIGMAFMFLILSLICSAIQELIAQVMNWRSAMLEEGITNLLHDPNVQDARLSNVADKIYEHPLVKKLAREGKKPSYIPARTFAVALLDVLKDPNAAGGPLTEAENTVKGLPNGQLKQTLGALIDGAEGKIEEVRGNIETWFDDSMDRVSGWYKRTAKKWMMGIALALAVLFNVNSIDVAQALWQEPTIRAMVVESAESFAPAQGEASELTIDSLKAQLEGLHLPIGWPASWRLAPDQVGPMLLSLVGWILTALAVSLGAPFWFDGLSKLLSIRASGKPPERAGQARPVAPSGSA
ncbi:MAG: hypothetical protein IIA27_15235 [Gemmatimonadetes bacterium]|nr:hypothetical protein [Gemmatimonadota bacterium]